MRVIAIRECANGNDSVGTQWLETKIFLEVHTLSDVMAWEQKIYRRNGKGRLILTVDEDAS